MQMLFYCLIALAIVIIYFKVVSKKKSKSKNNSIKCVLVVGSGGHTSELLKLIKHLSSHYQPRLYVMADNDTTSEYKIHSLHATCSCDYSVVKIPRSRQVGQSYGSAVLTTLYSTARSIGPIFVFKPKLVLCNGPGTCVPVCLIVFILSRLLGWGTKIVFVESVCRVQSLSLSAKILQYFADSVVVQWPELQNKYSFTVYLGRIL